MICNKGEELKRSGCYAIILVFLWRMDIGFMTINTIIREEKAIKVRYGEHALRIEDMEGVGE